MDYEETRRDGVDIIRLKITAFWDVAPYSLVGVDRRFRAAYRDHSPDDGGSTHL
jgi:hypothetical protein